MSLKKTTKHGAHSLTELNITPLLDLVFVLLVIFIITTPQLMNNLEMNLPSPKPPPKSDQKPKFTRIAIDAKGGITLNGAAVTLAQLKDQLATLKAADPELAVVVKGADAVEYQGMIGILDTLQQLDIDKVGLATD